MLMIQIEMEKLKSFQITRSGINVSFNSSQEVGANWIERFRFNVKPDDVFITSGTQNALAIILLSLFQPGDKIGTTQLTYTGFKSIVENGPTPSAIRISTSAIEDAREFKKGLTILKQLLSTSSESTKFTI